MLVEAECLGLTRASAASGKSGCSAASATLRSRGPPQDTQVTTGLLSNLFHFTTRTEPPDRLMISLLEGTGHGASEYCPLMALFSSETSEPLLRTRSNSPRSNTHNCIEGLGIPRLSIRGRLVSAGRRIGEISHTSIRMQKTGSTETQEGSAPQGRMSDISSRKFIPCTGTEERWRAVNRRHMR
jgi:hypothetical protein